MGKPSHPAYWGSRPSIRISSITEFDISFRLLTLWTVSTVSYEKRGLSVSECSAGPSPSFPCPGRGLTADSTRWRRQDGGQLLTALSLCLLRRFRNSRNKHNKTIGSRVHSPALFIGLCQLFSVSPVDKSRGDFFPKFVQFLPPFLPASGGLRLRL